MGALQLTQTAAIGASQPNPDAPHVSIILLNWNGWADTIECLESVFRLDYPRFSVIVCDNDSTDGSTTKIAAWAQGRLPASSRSATLAHLVTPPLPTPVSFAVREAGAVWDSTQTEALLLMPTGGNLGFAGGNNVGMRYALSRPECEYVWLLNNDTVVDPGALRAMVAAMQADPRLGLCGSVLRDYRSPGLVQTLGGRRYEAWSGRTHPVVQAQGEQPAPIDYVEGASMLARREFLEQVGLMAEDYFLYFEEMDWAMRARGRFILGYAPGSVVYHKLGQGLGSAPDRAARSPLSDHYATRNRLIFTARYHAPLLPSVLLSIAVAATHRLLAGRPENAKAILRGVGEALSFTKR